MIAAHGDLVLASKREHVIELNAGMAQAGGNLRLIDNKDQVLDQIGWGGGDSPEGQAAKAVKSGQALSRQCDELRCTDSDNNLVDFSAVSIDAPASGIGTGLPSSETDTAPNEDAQIEITELLPDPASPQTDTKDEFVELFNAGSDSVLLTGWKLVDAGGHSAKLDNVTIAANSYIVLYSATTKLSLNNDGDTVSLVRPTGEIVMTTPNYGAAKSGKSFGATPSGWGWLASVTPGSANTGLIAVDDSTTTATTTKGKKAAAGKPSKTSKPKAVSAKSPKLAKTANAAKDASAIATNGQDQQKSVPWTWLLAGVGLFAVGYGVYEYRPEILSFYDRLRAKFAARR